MLPRLPQLWQLCKDLTSLTILCFLLDSRRLAFGIFGALIAPDLTSASQASQWSQSQSRPRSCGSSATERSTASGLAAASCSSPWVPLSTATAATPALRASRSFRTRVPKRIGTVSKVDQTTRDLGPCFGDSTLKVFPHSFQPSFFSNTRVSEGFLERRIPAKNGGGTPRVFPSGQRQGCPQKCSVDTREWVETERFGLDTMARVAGFGVDWNALNSHGRCSTMDLTQWKSAVLQIKMRGIADPQQKHTCPHQITRHL